MYSVVLRIRGIFYTDPDPRFRASELMDPDPAIFVIDLGTF
jgi:hypothetical protein